MELRPNGRKHFGRRPSVGLLLLDSVDGLDVEIGSIGRDAEDSEGVGLNMHGQQSSCNKPTAPTHVAKTALPSLNSDNGSLRLDDTEVECSSETESTASH